MFKAIRRLFATIVLLLALLLGGGWYLATQTDLLSNTLVNGLLDSGIVQQRVEEALRAHEADIAQRIGASVEDVNKLVDDLDIGSWEAVDAPSDTAGATHIALDYADSPVDVTLYDDPQYVTIDAGGQQVTLRVSDAAQQYLQYLR